MGIETALVSLGMSAAAAGTAATAITAVGAGMAAGQLMKPSQQMPTIAPVTPPPAAQAGKTADRTAMLAANTAAARPGGAFAGNSSTFLTGAGGIDTRSLTLGRSTLLGQ